MNYETIVINGQRIFQPSKQFYGDEFFSAKYDCYRAHEIFISNLPDDLTEHELVPFLNQIGPVYQTRIMLNFSGFSKGKAYAILDDIDNAYKAVEKLNGKLIRDNWPPVKVTFSVNNCRLYLSFIDINITKEDILRQIININGVKDLKLYRSKNEWYQEGILIFKRHEQAAQARRTFLMENIQFGSNLKIKVEWAKPKDFQTLFFEHQGFVDEEMMRSILSIFSIKIIKIVIMGSRQIFVKFSLHEEAKLVLQELANLIPFKIGNGIITKVAWPIRK